MEGSRLRVWVCGGRDYNDAARVNDLLTVYNPETVGHGAARGADRLASEWARRFNVPEVAIPADWEKHGKAAGPIRNQRGIDEFRPNVVLAFPGGVGTADMIRRARAAGIHVDVVPA